MFAIHQGQWRCFLVWSASLLALEANIGQRRNMLSSDDFLARCSSMINTVIVWHLNLHGDLVNWSFDLDADPETRDHRILHCLLSTSRHSRLSPRNATQITSTQRWLRNVIKQERLHSQKVQLYGTVNGKRWAIVGSAGEAQRMPWYTSQGGKQHSEEIGRKSFNVCWHERRKYRIFLYFEISASQGCRYSTTAPGDKAGPFFFTRILNLTNRHSTSIHLPQFCTLVVKSNHLAALNYLTNFPWHE